MTDRRCYVTELERKVSRQKRRIKQLEADLAGRDQAYEQLKGQYKNVQDLARDLEQERDEYKAYCAEYRHQLKGQRMALDAKDKELRTVVDREHTIHNEAAAGMIDKVWGLEADLETLKGTIAAHVVRIEALVEENEKLQKALDLAASNEQVRMKQLAERELVIIQKAERIKELQEANSKLILDQEYNEKLLAQHEEAAGDRPTSLERDIQRALNYWGADADLGTADFILAHFLNRQLLSLKAMKRAEREHGIPPTRVTNARLAHISIDDDGLGTIDVIE